MKFTRCVRSLHLLCALPMILGLFNGLLGAADPPRVVVAGLQSPSKIIGIGRGSYLVTETGEQPNTGQVSLVTLSGAHKVLLSGLPSGLAAPDFAPDGPNGIAWTGRILYVANAEGDAYVNGPTPGSLIPNPAGISSPLFSTIIRANFSGDLEQLSEGFAMTAADQSRLADGLEVKLTNSANESATVQLVTAFRPGRPDPRSIYRNTHLYGIALSPYSPRLAYVADAGNNAIWRVNGNNTPQLLTRFPSTPNPPGTPGPPASEAVPTSVREAGGRLLVSLLGGAPFLPGATRVVSVDPQTGATETVVDNLTSVIDVLPARARWPQQNYYVLQFSTNLAAGAPGQLIRIINGQPRILAEGLITPSSMAIDDYTDDILITSRSRGELLSVPRR